MKLIEYYIQLFAVFSQSETFQPVKLSRFDASNELTCSERNVIHVLNKMEYKEWIVRKKGKGRGNITTITFLKTLEEMFQYYGEYYPKYDDVERLIVLLEAYQLLHENDQLIDTLMLKIFGFHVELNRPGEEAYEHLKIPYFRSLHSLNPSDVERQTERHMANQVFNTLVTCTTDKKKIEPCISHYWEQDDHGKKWTFYLRKGITFHNGKKLEAEDVKFSFERLRNTPSKWIVRHLNSIRCLGKHVIQFVFYHPVYCWDLFLCSPKCSIIPINYGDKTIEEFCKQPIGTGPYQIKEHNKLSLILTVNQSYFLGRAHIDKVSIFILPSIEKYFSVNKWEHDPFFYIPFTTKKDEEINYQYIERKNLSTKYMMWNMNKRYIKTNPSLRNKVESIIDREKMVIDLGYPRFEPTQTFIKHDTILEKQTYFDAPEDCTFKEPLTLMTYELNPNEADMKWFQSECGKHGIKVEVIQVPYSNFMTEIKKADIVLAEYVKEEVEEVSLYNLFQSGNSVVCNMVDQKEKEVIHLLIDRAMEKEEQKERMDLIKQVEKRLIEQCIILPLYATFQKAMYHENLMGISLNAIGLVPFEKLFYRK